MSNKAAYTLMCPCPKCTGGAWPDVVSLSHHQASPDFVSFLNTLFAQNGGRLPPFVSCASFAPAYAPHHGPQGSSAMNMIPGHTGALQVYIIEHGALDPPHVNVIPGRDGLPERYRPNVTSKEIRAREREADASRCDEAWGGWMCRRSNCPLAPRAKYFKTRAMLINHWTMRHGDASVNICQFCGDDLATPGALEEHYDQAHTFTRYQCMVTGCTRNFRTNRDIAQHLDQHNRLSSLPRPEKWKYILFPSDPSTIQNQPAPNDPALEDLRYLQQLYTPNTLAREIDGMMSYERAEMMGGGRAR